MANRSAAGFGKVMSVTSATFLSTGTRAYASCGRYRFKSQLAVVGPVELWATRQRRPSAAANPHRRSSASEP